MKGGGKTRQEKIKRDVAKAVQERVSYYYKNANINTSSVNKMSEKIIIFH